MTTPQHPHRRPARLAGAVKRHKIRTTVLTAVAVLLAATIWDATRSTDPSSPPPPAADSGMYATLPYVPPAELCDRIDWTKTSIAMHRDVRAVLQHDQTVLADGTTRHTCTADMVVTINSDVPDSAARIRVAVDVAATDDPPDHLYPQRLVDAHIGSILAEPWLLRDDINHTAETNPDFGWEHLELWSGHDPNRTSKDTVFAAAYAHDANMVVLVELRLDHADEAGVGPAWFDGLARRLASEIRSLANPYSN